MKKHLSFLCLALFLGGMMSFWIFIEAKAQIDFFTFFIPYRTDDLGQIFSLNDDFDLDPGESITETISISVHRDNTVIYYDHREDGGLEANLTSPSQPTTIIWGDGDPSNNGTLAELPHIKVNNQPIATTLNVNDVLQAGDVIVLQNEVELPRDDSVLLFDGGDKLTAQGGPLAVTLAVWPYNKNDCAPILCTVGTLFAGAWELYPTNNWGREYEMPIGQDLAGVRPGFTSVRLNIQAALDNTTVQLDLDGAPGFENSITLDQGEQFVATETIDVGDRILVAEPDKPVQAHLFTLNPNVNYEARAYTIFPRDDWSDRILAPRSSDGDFWLYNPQATPLDIEITTSTGPVPNLTIPANSTAKYPPAGLSGATGVLFESTNGQDFYGVAALDQAERQDWGYALLPVEALTTQTLVGWGPGNNNNPPDGDQSRVYVTALQTTTIQADFNNDGTPDDSFQVFPYQEVPITKTVPFASPNDLTGTYLYTEDGTPFLAVWGQDEGADIALPSIDVGTSIVPFPTLLIQKSISAFAKEVTCSEITPPGKVIQYRLEYLNLSTNPLDNVIVNDMFNTQQGPLGQEYIPGTTLINGVPIPDDITGTTTFPLDEAGYNIGLVTQTPSGQNNYITFDAALLDPTIIGSNQEISNTARLSSKDSSSNSDFVKIFTPALTETQSIYKINSTLVDPADGVVNGGDTITYSVNFTNTGVSSITTFPVRYVFDDTYLTFLNASPVISSQESGLLIWDDLGSLAPGATGNITLSFLVADSTMTNTVTLTNEVFGVGGQLGANALLPTCNNEITTTLRFATSTPTPTPSPTGTPTPTPSPTGTPTLTPSPTGTSSLLTLTPTGTPFSTSTPSSDDDDDDDDDSTPTPTPPASSNNTPTPSGGTPIADLNPPADEVSLPVAFLPETGIQAPSGPPVWFLLAVSVIGIAVGFWKFYWRRN